MMQDMELSIERLTELKSLGVQLAIDDFGTGYSSLNYVRRFPVDILKVDKSFIDGVSEERRVVSALTAAVIELAGHPGAASRSPRASSAPTSSSACSSSSATSGRASSSRSRSRPTTLETLLRRASRDAGRGRSARSGLARDRSRSIGTCHALACHASFPSS